MIKSLDASAKICFCLFILSAWTFGVGPGTFTQLWSQFGTSQSVFISWVPQYWELSYGSSGVPITTPGPSFKISRTESVNKSICNANAVDNECNASLAVYSNGISTSSMQTNAIFAGAKGQPIGTDVVGLFAIGDLIGTGTGIGTGAYIEGRNDTTNTGNFLGAEIRANNQTTASYSYSSSGFSSGGLWITAQSANVANLIGMGIALGHVSTAQFDVGYGAIAGSVKNYFLRDDTSAITSIGINGTHTYGIDLTGMSINAGGSALLAPLSTPANSSATCKQGAIEWDTSFIYICTATNTWKRATLNTF